MVRKYPRILYFIASSVPTDADYEEAENMGPNVAFRNASVVPEDAASGSLELCDGVAGKVPKPYAEKYPSARDAIENYIREEQDRRMKKRDGQPESLNVGISEATPIVTPTEAPTAAPKAAKAAAAWTPNQ